jgi:hypothetical protein
MTKSLLKPDTTDGANFLRARFVGFLGTVDIGDMDESLADCRSVDSQAKD